MDKPRISLIVAMARKGVIGRGGSLPWRLSADLKRFKSLTMGHHIVMGRKTWDSLGRPLPGRVSVVLSRKEPGVRSQESVLWAKTLDEALALTAGDSEIFIIGGREIYELALPRADRLYVTHVEADVEGDTVFPCVDWQAWRLIEESAHGADEKNEYPHRYCIYERQTGSGGVFAR